MTSIHISRIKVLAGPNMFGRQPVLEIHADLADQEKEWAVSLPDFADNLLAVLPDLQEHHDETGSFTQQLRSGASLAYVLERITLELQTRAGLDASFGRTIAREQPGRYYVLVEYGQSDAGEEAAEVAEDLINKLIAGESGIDLTARIARIRRIADRHGFNQTDRAIAQAATELGIPVRRLEDEEIVQLGHGRYARRISGGRTSSTGAIAAELARDSERTRNMLAEIGLPVPDEDAEEGEEAPGAHFRLLVVGGKMAAAVQTERDKTRDVTANVHPGNAMLAEVAAQTIGLDVAGIEIVCLDIAVPLREQGGVIVAVEEAPELAPYLKPDEGDPQPVGAAIVRMLFPEGAPTRVPLIAITGTNGKTTVTRMIGHIVGAAGYYVGMATTDGVYFGGERWLEGDCSGPRSAAAVLQHPLLEAAVLETARGGILRSGLAWDRSTVSVVLNISNDHIGLEGVQSVEDLARVKGVIVENVLPDGYAVLNAEDPLVRAMAARVTDGIIYFSMTPDNEVIKSHLAAGKRAAYLRGDDTLVLAEGDTETALMNATDIPATHGGIVPFQIANALAAAAASWGAGVSVDVIRQALSSFNADERIAPGRFNMFKVGGATVIVDYGHNPHAMRAIKGAIERMQPRRAIGMVGTAGDRRDSDLRELAAIAATIFDIIYIRESYSRGREEGGMFRIMADAIAEVRPDLPVRTVADTEQTVDEILHMLQDGDVAVLFSHLFEQTIAQVKAEARARDEGSTRRHGDTETFSP